MNTRIKLNFSKDIFDDDRNKVWFLLPDGCKYISDLHYAIINEFDLQKKCKHGLKIKMDDHILLPNQSILILRDGDLVNIEKQKASSKNLRAKRKVRKCESLTKRKRIKRSDSSSSSSLSSSSSSLTSSSSSISSSSTSSTNSDDSSSEENESNMSKNILNIPEKTQNGIQEVPDINIIKETETPTKRKKKKKRRKSNLNQNDFENDEYYNESIVYVNKLNMKSDDKNIEEINIEQALPKINYDLLEDANIESLKKGDQIAFKMYEISSQMTPEIGPWRSSTVISNDIDTITVKLFEKINLEEEFSFLAQFLVDESNDDIIELKKSDLLGVKKIPS